MKEITLISVDSVKEITGISDNLTPKYLRPAILQSQEDRYLPVVGQKLYDKLRQVADSGLHNLANNPYFALLDKSKYFLAYSAVAKVLPQVSYKVANAGVVTTGDDNMQQVDRIALDNLVKYYKNEADSACFRLQRWLLNNKKSYPELTQNQCNQIKANLRTSASCGILI